MTDSYVCWKCGASIESLSQPLERTDSCPGCRAELYVCRMCEFYDPRVSGQCREPIADHVANKERANFCGYFKLRPGAYTSTEAATEGARSQLAALFGESGAEEPTAAQEDGKAALDKLFGSNDNKPD